MKEKQSPSVFLNAGGAAADAIRSIDWTEHILGPPEDWPASLRISLNLILKADLPMLLVWGTDHICFYNDALIHSLDSGDRHPGAMGKKADKAWGETWSYLKTYIEQVLQEDIAITYEEYLLPLFHNSMSLLPLKDELGNTTGVLAVCKEPVSTIVAEREL